MSSSKDSPNKKVKLSNYESQKLRDWYHFSKYLNENAPEVCITDCKSIHAIEFLKSLNKFGRTKVHVKGCAFFGEADPGAPCKCPLMQAWGSLETLVGRLRICYEEHVGAFNGINPFSSLAMKAFLREVKETQAIARGVSFVRKRNKKTA